MRALTALSVTICILYQAYGMSIKDHMQGSTREAREINAPGPIDCKMTAWSEWTPCDPCTKTTYRSRGIEVFGQFKGLRCIDPIGDRKACVPNTECQMDPPPVCKSSEFTCSSGLCINSRLKCNGDFDCGDSDTSDEDECEVFKAPCGRTPVVESDIALQAGYGINILGTGPRMNPFNNKLYNGQCNRVREPTTLEYSRIPWNVGVLNYETKVEESMSKDIYEDIHSLIREITTESSTTFGLSLNFKFTPTEASSGSDSGSGSGSASASASASGSASGSGSGSGIGGSAGINTETERTSMIKQLSELTNTKRKTFMRVKGRVELATYRMKQRGLEVSQDFLNAVDDLPLTYEKGRYFGFLEDYGTHFTKNGRTGGEYELVYVINEDIKKEKHVTESMLKTCFKLGLEGNIQLGKKTPGTPEIGGSVRPANCNTLTPKNTDDDTKRNVVEKVLMSVKGGSTDSAIAMKTYLNTNPMLDYTHYIEWARTISIRPALIYSDPEPIYNAIPLDLPDAQPRRDNLRVALDDYVTEYSVCKCQPCQNGGTVIQIDGECKCLCLAGTDGVACQNTDHEVIKDKLIEQQGNWGCWSAWSTCSGGRHRRTRTCNTQGLTNAKCKGDIFKEDYC